MTTSQPLHLAAVYRRRVNASLDRIWENVFDWQHLSHLHASSFADCQLIRKGDWGWQARLTTLGAAQSQIIDLRVDRPAGKYVSTTTEGQGLGSEIRVALTTQSAMVTDVVVEFHLPEADPARLAALGQAYCAAYARLWDEDEVMMMAREAALAPQTISQDSEICLGSEAEVLGALPLLFEVGGGRYRLVQLEGVLAAHATACPHWLGPLENAPVIDATVECPWHGYVFSVLTGQCLTVKNLQLAAAPTIICENGSIYARI